MADSAALTAAWQKCTAADAKAAKSGALADSLAALRLWKQFNAMVRASQQARKSKHAAH